MYGKLTIGLGSAEQKELEITEFVQARYKDNRVIAVSKIEDETFLLSVENPPSTGRESQVKMWLSKESMAGLMATIIIYLGASGVDYNKLMEESFVDGEVDFSFSDNLNNPFQ